MESFIGGLVIGSAASLLWVWNGRVMGMSGILYQALRHPRNEIIRGWRWEFLGGLLLGGVILAFLNKDIFGDLQTPWYILVPAGLLVGVGTRMGGGCTSGHGICGVSRLSKRSLVATGVFMVFGILSATFIRQWLLI